MRFFSLPRQRKPIRGVDAVRTAYPLEHVCAVLRYMHSTRSKTFCLDLATVLALPQRPCRFEDAAVCNLFQFSLCYSSGSQTLARGRNLARGAFSSGPHRRVNKTISANFINCRRSSTVLHRSLCYGNDGRDTILYSCDCTVFCVHRCGVTSLFNEYYSANRPTKLVGR